jgi:bifunctional DNA-binding transcriptional regulator/antitoxin component of YhaV-PrlF toxin-antitoxin module
MSQATAGGQLQEDITEIVKVQDNNGCNQITIPIDAVEDLDIDKGDGVLVTGNEGDRSLKLKPSSALLD